MSKKFIFVNTDGIYEESVGAYESADFIAASTGVDDAGKPIKTDATGKLAGSFIDQTDVDHANITNTHNLTTDVDHGSINGLGDDDHTIYIKTAGTRAFTGIQSYDNHKTFTTDTSIVDKKYVDDKVATAGTSAEWMPSVLDSILTPPLSPNSGDRYLINGVGTDAWATHDYDAVEWNGTAWVFTTPSAGTYISVDDEIDSIFYFGGTGPWVKKYYESTTASLGVKKIGMDLRADLLASGGLKLNSNSICVEPADFAGAGLIDDGADKLTIDWSTTFDDSKAVKASDLSSQLLGKGGNIIGLYDSGNIVTATTIGPAIIENRTAIDAIEDNAIGSTGETISTSGTVGADNLNVDINWSTTFNDSKAVKASDLASSSSGKGAGIIGIEDAGNYTTQTKVEGAIQELYSKIVEFGTDYIVGTGDVTKGDLVHISAADTVVTHTLTSNAFAIGIAASTKSASSTVKVLGNDTVIKNILSGATPGDKYYWTNSGWSITRPSVSGNYVWLGGIAKNSTDLQIEIQFIMKVA